MSLPRQILPGSTYLLTRRCTQRQFLLKPTPLTSHIFLYCLAVAAQRTGVLVHAACVMSNYWHATLTDPLGRIPEFMAFVHKYVAKAVNASLGRRENLWASEPPSLVRLQGPQDVIDKMVYTLSNSVAAELLARAEQWHGDTLMYRRDCREYSTPMRSDRLLTLSLLFIAACRAPVAPGAAPTKVPPQRADSAQETVPSSPQGAPTTLSAEAGAQAVSQPAPEPQPAPAAPPPSITPELPALPEPTTAAEWAKLLPYFHFLAESGKCREITWSEPPCRPGMSVLAIMDEPPRGETNGYVIGFVRTLPRRASGARLCLSSWADITGLFPTWEQGVSIRLDNALASAVMDLTRERVDCETFAEAQAESARTGEPY